MDVEKFMIKQGWKKGEGLRPGGIKNALLVKHRKDNKGLGFNPQASEGWWERVFDGHLKSLDVNVGKSTGFKFDEEKRRRETSPLYAHFRSGGMLDGTIASLKDQKKKEKKEKKRSSDASRSNKELKHSSEKISKKRKRDS